MSMIPQLRYNHCEWCGRPAGGDLLCPICERQQIWDLQRPAPVVALVIVSEGRAESETEPDSLACCGHPEGDHGEDDGYCYHAENGRLVCECTGRAA